MKTPVDRTESPNVRFIIADEPAASTAFGEEISRRSLNALRPLRA
jgi:hypothetical protein